MNVNLKWLIARMNDTTRSALEAAAGLCLSRTHYDIEIEHFLTKLLDQQDGDLAHILKHFGADKSRFTAELSRALDKLKTGNARTPSFSPSLVKLFTSAWSLGSLEYGGTQIRSGFAIVALLADEELSRIARDFSRELQTIQPETLRRDFLNVVAGSPENAAAASASAPGAASGVQPGGGKTPNLDQFTVNLTENARLGKIDAVLGRDSEIRQIVDILMRRRQNNSILTGEAGVGKTAVVEGFAIRLARGDVPPPLKDVSLYTLDIGLLQAGASMKGEFENRLRQVIDEVQASPKPIILFVDEAHTLIGAGGAAGTGDAANLLKPALARGTLRTIGATTWAEYKKYIEKDPALTRRFQTVKVEEPTEAKALLMMRGVVSVMEKHHRVQVLDEALEAAVKLAHRYVPDRQLPDKSVSLLDTACARVAVSHHATPAEVEDCQRRIEALQTELEIVGREAAIGIDTAERAASAEKSLGEERERLKGLQAAWEREKGIVDEILALRAKLR